VKSVVGAAPHQRLRWHYFVLWQMIGVELWQETFTGGVGVGVGPVRSGAGPTVESPGGSTGGRSRE
jgi:hypothetical protein